MKIAAVAALFLILVPSVALGEDLKDIPPGEDVIQSLHKGDPAPFTGQLFDTDTSLRWANWLNQYRVILEAGQDKSKASCQSDLTFQNDVHNIEMNNLEALNVDLTKRLQNSEQNRLQLQQDSSAWYNSIWFGIVLGAAAATGTIFITTQAF